MSEKVENKEVEKDINNQLFEKIKSYIDPLIDLQDNNLIVFLINTLRNRYNLNIINDELVKYLKDNTNLSNSDLYRRCKFSVFIKKEPKKKHNKEDKTSYHSEYYEKNKEKIREKNLMRYYKNKEKKQNKDDKDNN